MQAPSADTPPGVYRGWRVAAACFLLAFWAWGIGFYGHGFYMVALGRTTGWSAAMLSSLVGGFWLANMAASLLLGRVIDRRGARPAVVYGALAMAAGAFGLAAFEAGWLAAPWQLFAIFLLMGSAYPGLAALAISAALIPWFKRRLGMALGIGLTGASAGGAVMPPLMAWLAGVWGFAATMAGLGAALLLSVLPVAWLAIRPPRGREAEREMGAKAAEEPAGPPTSRRFLLDVHFWRIALASAFALGAQIGFLMHQIPLLQGSLGLAGAALAVSVAAASAALGRFLLGALTGRLPLAWLAAGCYLIQLAGLLALLAGGPAVLLFAASAIAGLVIGCIVMLPPLLLVDRFGAEGYGAAYGLTAALMFVMGGLATAAGGWLHDRTGGYDWPLMLLIGMHVAASLLILWRGDRPQGTADEA